MRPKAGAWEREFKAFPKEPGLFLRDGRLVFCDNLLFVATFAKSVRNQSTVGPQLPTLLTKSSSLLTESGTPLLCAGLLTPHTSDRRSPRRPLAKPAALRIGGVGRLAPNCATEFTRTF